MADISHLTLERFFALAPFAVIITGLVLVGVAIAVYFTSQHIATLKKWIETIQRK